MPQTPMPRILVVGDPPPDDVRGTFEAAGFPVEARGFAGIDAAEAERSQLIVLDVTAATAGTAQALCRRWRIELGELYVPFVWLYPGVNSAVVAGALDAGADLCLERSIPAHQLLAQAKALLRVQQMNARLMIRAGEAQQINHRLQQAYQQIDSDIEMARRIHRGFQPRILPDVERTRFSVCFRPRSRTGGDFYDVIRLDENHCAAFVADASGHGLPTSSLLSIFVKKSLQLKEISGRSYRLVPPAEVLGRLNRELLGLGMSDPPLVSMLYLQLNCQDGSLCFARASHPHPLYVPANGEPEYWETTGSLVGVFEADFNQHNRSLQPGDKLLLMSDGTASAASDGDPLLESVRKRQREPLQTFVENLTQDLMDNSQTAKDFTLLGIEYR